jgi:hypothetical protein
MDQLERRLDPIFGRFAEPDGSSGAAWTVYALTISGERKVSSFPIGQPRFTGVK